LPFLSGKQSKRGLDTVLAAMEILLDPARDRNTVLTELYLAVDESELRRSLERCRAFQRLEARGYLDELRARHSYLKRYLPAFLTLPFQGEPGQERLLAAIDLAPKEDGQLDQRLWEITLAFAVRDALRAGDLSLPESRHHVSFSNLIYGDRHWQQERSDAYRELNLPFQADQVIPQLRAEFDEVAKALLKGFPDNPFAKIQDGTLKLKCRDTLPIPPWIKKLRRPIHTCLPRVRIENLLAEVDSRCHFTQAFRPLEGTFAACRTGVCSATRRTHRPRH
jgi:hypothetical protein